jgi:phosphoserine phosphatase
MRQNKINLVSSDLNGTLVHQHTMMDMIRVFFPQEPERYEKAKDAFTKQTSGLLSMKEAFETAGPLTKGLRLKDAVDYASATMRYVKGFNAFISALYESGIYFVINSTGYTVTTETIRSVYGKDKIYDTICNRLVFGEGGDPEKPLSEMEISRLVDVYFKGKKNNSIYNEIRATGVVELGICDENEKAARIFEIAAGLKIDRSEIAHIGDTMGDSGGICGVAEAGGLGIAFNYNGALKNHLDSFMKTSRIKGKILLSTPKSEHADISVLLPHLI